MMENTIRDGLQALAGANSHIHTVFSPCAARMMTTASIVAAADRGGLEAITLTDHHHPGNRHLATLQKSLRAELDTLPPHRVKISLGAELSAHGINMFSDTWEESCTIGFRMYACNHYHLKAWEHPAQKTAQAYREHCLAVLQALIASGRAHCVAHPFVGSYLTAHLEDTTTLTAAFSDDDLDLIFEAARRHNVAMEINTRHLLKDLAFARRYLRTAFASGARLLIGTDAHTLAEIDPHPQVAALIAELSCRN